MDEIAQRRAFKSEARYQGSCQHPECTDAQALWEAHHIVYEQHVEQYAPDKVWDPRNALRLCRRPCHPHHHNGKARVPVSALPDSVFDFALDIMTRGQAVNYLARYYEGTIEEVEARLG